MADITDGASHTAAICEVWGRKYHDHITPPNSPLGDESSRGMNLHSAVYFDFPPNSNHFDPWHANSFHPGGVNTVFADGSVHFLYDTIDLTVFKAISTRGGEELVEAGF
jgi:prepilin-type processing-associated H-X9-DG protein